MGEMINWKDTTSADQINDAIQVEITGAMVDIVKKHDIAGSTGEYNLYHAVQNAVQSEYDKIR